MSANGKRPAFEDLTKRELFAAMAMQGMCASDLTVSCAEKVSREGGYAPNSVIAELAVQQADALLRKLEEGK